MNPEAPETAAIIVPPAGRGTRTRELAGCGVSKCAMVVGTLLALMVAGSNPAPARALPPIPNDTTHVAGASPPLPPADTTRRRPKALDVSDWYYRRLEIHQWGSYAILPLFAFQYIPGNQIFPDPSNA